MTKNKNNQIIWKEFHHSFYQTKFYHGFYNGEFLFYIDIDKCLFMRGMYTYIDLHLNSYKTIKSAKRGAERFLKRLQDKI